MVWHQPYTMPAEKMDARGFYVQAHCTGCTYRSSPTVSADRALKAGQMHADVKNEREVGTWEH